MTKEELTKILEDHKVWLDDNEKGKKADLSCANLRGADLRGANLSCANLYGANLSCANLYNIRTNKNCYQISGVGRISRQVSYFLNEDIVVCGCWECKEGNTLENFKKRVEDIYGENGEKQNSLYYQEYLEVIKFFESMKQLNKSDNNNVILP